MTRHLIAAAATSLAQKSVRGEDHTEPSYLVYLHGKYYLGTYLYASKSSTTKYLGKFLDIYFLSAERPTRSRYSIAVSTY